MQTDVKLEGLLIVDKPLGVSSMDVVRKVRWAAGRGPGAARKQKVGHAGTLDPLATGVVVCCLGKATRLVDQLMGQTKIYEAVVDMSAFTITDDREGDRENVTVHSLPTQEKVLAALRGFTGEIDQVPPLYSAIHIQGQRAYKIARRGGTAEIPPRKVRIDQIDLLKYNWPLVELRITCGKGTYIRSIARDLGKVLGTGGHLAALRRTASGNFDLSQAVDWQRLDTAPIEQKDLINWSVK